MTADDLQVIALRHANDERWLPSRCKGDLSPLAGSALLAHEERGQLLALVRRLAEMKSHDEEYDCCHFCETNIDTPHATDCLWLIAQGAKP